MNPSHTDITIVLDRSGSMFTVADDTRGGYNKFLADQKKVPGSATLTLHQFDHEFETPYPAADIQKAAPLTAKTYVPRGNTALLDAIGRSITDTGARLDREPETKRAGKVVFVIITDGLENASREYNKAKVDEMIKHQRDKYAWEFVYLGANQDALSEARSYGISAANSISYATNAAGVQSVFDSSSNNLTAFRRGIVATMAFQADAYMAQAKAGVTKAGAKIPPAKA